MSTTFYWITNGAAIGLSICFLFGAWLLDRQWKKRFTTVNITLIATLCALSVVLTNVIGYSQILGMRIMVGNFILFLTGMIFGPIAGVLIGVVTDGVGSLVFLGGIYHSGFMLEKIIFGFLGSLIFTFKTVKWWQVKVFILMGLGIILQLFVLTPISLWASGGAGYMIASLIKKVIIFPIELTIYPILTITSMRVIWLLLAKIPNSQTTVWAMRKGDVRFLLKPKKTMTEELSKKERKTYLQELKGQQKIIIEKEV